jgi:hypothetical protein
MIQALNSLTNDYELQMLLLEKRIGSKENPLTIHELKEEVKKRLWCLPNSKVNVEIAVKSVIRRHNANQSR